MKMRYLPSVVAMGVALSTTTLSAFAATPAPTSFAAYTVESLGFNENYQYLPSKEIGSIDFSQVTDFQPVSGTFSPREYSRNASGQIAGSYATTTVSYPSAFITAENGQNPVAVDSLNTLNFQRPANAAQNVPFFTVAFDINNSGQFLARGTGGNAYRFTPAVPEPTTVALMLAGLGLVAVAKRRRTRSSFN
jgi:hypothetical protein